MKRLLDKTIHQPISIAPLVIFRIIFGAIMFISVVRFAINGWISEFYIQPNYFFTYYGFDWLQPLPGWGMYIVFIVMALSALAIMTGFRYRLSALVFFFSFTYVELLDKTYYLNHYYFISIISFLMIWLPAHAGFSLDARRNPSLRAESVPAWTINILKLQIGLVYFFAGLAKINSDWLLEAMPLSIWLPARSHWPVVGPLFNELWMAFAFSWFGMLYDLFVPFLLLKRNIRLFAYAMVIIFHLATWLLFPIGMFPFIMIGLTLIFFSADFHLRLLHKLEQLFRMRPIQTGKLYSYSHVNKRFAASILSVFLLLQILMPCRHLLYPGKLFWTEEGYRFSWRVMLMEKSGMCTFFIREGDDEAPTVVENSRYLTQLQEHMMATQPDMILQFAHYLYNEYKKHGMEDPRVYAECYVTLQGARSRSFVDTSVDLAKVKRGFHHKNWILPFE